MESKKAAALIAILLILASLLFTSCATKQGGAQVQPPTTTGASLIVIDNSGNALPIVFSFSREVNGVKYYLDNGKELTKEEILSSLEPRGMTVAEVSEIWGISIADVFALFTTEQLSGRSLPAAATYAAAIYDMWECLTNGPPEVREYPRAVLAGLVPNIDMRDKVFDFLEKQKKSSVS
jgi:predicted small secreted protein